MYIGFTFRPCSTRIIGLYRKAFQSSGLRLSLTASLNKLGRPSFFRICWTTLHKSYWRILTFTKAYRKTRNEMRMYLMLRPVFFLVRQSTISDQTAARTAKQFGIGLRVVTHCFAYVTSIWNENWSRITLFILYTIEIQQIKGTQFGHT